MRPIALYAASLLTGLWGVAHLFATKGVITGFGDISMNNRRILVMEWIVEGVALLSIATLVAAVTAVQPETVAASVAYAVTAGTLVLLAAVSLFTGFRVAFLPFRLCPIIFSVSAALIVIGAWL